MPSYEDFISRLGYYKNHYRVDDYINQKNDLRHSLGFYKRDNQLITDECEQLVLKRSDVRERIDSKSKDLEDLRSKMAQTQRDFGEMKKRHKELLLHLKQHNSQISALESGIGDLKKKDDELKIIARNLDNSHAATSRNIDDSSSTLSYIQEQAQKQLQDKIDRISQVEKDITKFRRLRKKVLNEVGEVESKENKQVDKWFMIIASSTTVVALLCWVLGVDVASIICAVFLLMQILLFLFFRKSKSVRALCTKADKVKVGPFKDFGISDNMVFVQGGSFVPISETLPYNSKPEVTVNSFYMNKYCITVEIYEKVMGTKMTYNYTPKKNRPDDRSWAKVNLFISKLNELTGKDYRLPTEAEWEWAACGGLKSSGFRYAGSDNIDDVAWYRKNTDSYRHKEPVGLKKPNELGLYDMSGNVNEWCIDRYPCKDDKQYKIMSLNPMGPSIGNDRVSKGGRSEYTEEDCTISKASDGSVKYHYAGIRLVSSSI